MLADQSFSSNGSVNSQIKEGMVTPHSPAFIPEFWLTDLVPTMTSVFQTAG